MRTCLRPGLTGGFAAVTSAPADGYTLLLTDDSMMTINPQIYKNLGYDAKKDFLPVSLIATFPPRLSGAEQFSGPVSSRCTRRKPQPNSLLGSTQDLLSSRHELTLRMLEEQAAYHLK